MELNPGNVPAHQFTDDLWRLELLAPDGAGKLARFWVSDVPRGAAERAFADWATDKSASTVWCTSSHSFSQDVTCRHASFPAGPARRWRNADIEVMRIMPMREAV